MQFIIMKELPIIRICYSKRVIIGQLDIYDIGCFIRKLIDAIITFRNSQYTRFRRSPNKAILIFADRSHLPHGNSIHRINIIKLHIRSIYVKNRKEKKEYKQL